MEIKSGLEIHQQLDTHKLFCKCPSILRNDEPSYVVKRKLHAVAGESGEIDVAAKHEASQDKEFWYQGYDTTCLVELDEEPPLLINEEALQTALHISLLLHCEILPITQIMRKTVVDGSNTGGFQRTALIAKNGYIDSDYGRVGIGSVYLEEDAARPVLRESDRVIYRLDRLGIPLVEIQTEADIKSPEQAKEVALHIGDILRSCKVKRGIGTIRQDINVSTKGHPRIEIKGFQDPKIMIKTVENEIKRQKGLVEINEELVKRKADVGEPVDLSKIFLKSESKIIKSALEKKGKVYGIKLSGFKGLMGREFYLGRRFGTELSDYAKIAGVKGLIHSDEDLKKYKISNDELKSVIDKLKISEEDGFVIIADEKEKAKNAIEFVILRAKIQINKSSEPEVRNAKDDASTVFLRPMPGSARMYPETDLPLLRITKKLIDNAKKTLPRLRSEISEELIKRGLTAEQVKMLLKEEKLEEFKVFLKLVDDPKFVFKSLIEIPKEISRHEGKDLSDVLTLDIIEEVVKNVSESKIDKSDVKHVMEEVVKGKSLDKAISLEKADIGDVESEIAKLVKEKPGLSVGGYMGLIMQKFKGKISGRDANEILNKLIK